MNYLGIQLLSISFFLHLFYSFSSPTSLVTSILAIFVGSGFANALYSSIKLEEK